MRKTDKLDKYYVQALDSLKDAEKDQDFPKYFYKLLLSGDNEVYQKVISETKHFDGEWVKTLESYFPSIDRILRNPKNSLKYDEELVAIERAKKTNSRSIQHLASHTQYIKEIREGDMIIPKKILTTNADLQYAIYENRFIKTLINRLYAFVSNRYEVIRTNFESFQKNHVNMDSHFEINKSEVSINIDMLIKKDLDDEEINKHNKELLARAEHLKDLISSYKTSPFMKELKEAKPVVPPIMKTNIMLHNADFRNAYTLWLFLDRYNILGYDVDVQSKNLPVENLYLKALYRLGLLTYSTIVCNQKERQEAYKNLEIIEYSRKGTKLARTHIDDVVQNPDAITMEDNAINEYYLDQNKKVFNKRLEEILSETHSYDTALRRALNQTIAITNSLYKAVFEFSEEEDIFTKLVKDVDLDDALNKAKNQARVARIIRETKEVDYNKAIRLEKKLMQDIDNLNGQVIIREKDAMKESVKAEQIALMKKERERAKLNIKVLEDELKGVLANRQVLLEQQRAINKALKDRELAITKAKKELIKKEQQKAMEYRTRELLKIREREKKAKEKAALKEKLMKQKAEATLKARQKQLEKEAQIKIEAELKKIRAKSKTPSPINAPEETSNNPKK